MAVPLEEECPDEPVVRRGEAGGIAGKAEAAV